MMGVAHDLFWTLTPKSLDPYVKAFNLKREYDDSISWQNGIYIRMAIGSMLDSKTKYPEQPLSATAEATAKVEDSKKRMENMKETMKRRMAVVNKQFNK